MSARFATRPGSTAWLIRHEMRLAWRGVGGKRAMVMLGVLAVLSVALHVGAWMLLRSAPAGDWPPVVAYLLGGAAWLCITLMLAQAIAASVLALFDRGDLDLLLSSPLPTRNVFLARGLGIAANLPVLYLFFLAPFADVGLFVGHANLLAIYPALFALSLGVTALALALTLLLVRWLGARRARSVAQVLGSLVGAAMFLTFQVPNFAGPEFTRHMIARLMTSAQPGGALALDSPLWWPARALQGDLLAMLAIAVLGAGAFWAVIGLAHRRFLDGTQESVTGSARRGLASPRAGSTRFRGGLGRTVLVKEWRLIARDPQVITQTLMQVLYMMPAMFLIMRSASQALVLLVPAMVYIASTLASNIAWLTVAAEDAPELLGTAPVPTGRLRALKVAAALLPVWGLVSPLVAWLAWRQPLEGLIFVACLAGGTLSVGTAQIWYPRQGKRTDLKKRMQGHGVLGMLELAVVLSWGALAYCLGGAPAWTPLALLCAALGSGSIWLLGRSRREDEA